MGLLIARLSDAERRVAEAGKQAEEIPLADTLQLDGEYLAYKSALWRSVIKSAQKAGHSVPAFAPGEGGRAAMSADDAAGCPDLGTVLRSVPEDGAEPAELTEKTQCNSANSLSSKSVAMRCSADHLCFSKAL